MGADAEMIALLDEGLRHLARVIKRDLGIEVDTMPGAGAAGAMGAGMVAFFGAKLQMGIETVLDTVGFDEAIHGADTIFTGEGKLDSQSLRGKVVVGVARRAAKQGVPVIAIVGGADYGAEATYNEGVTAIFPINRLLRTSPSSASTRKRIWRLPCRMCCESCGKCRQPATAWVSIGENPTSGTLRTPSRRRKLHILHFPASGKAQSFRCSSFRNRTRCAGLRFRR